MPANATRHERSQPPWSKRLWILFSLVDYPVRFLRFSPIGRKRLLDVWRFRVAACPDESGINCSAFIYLLVIEFTSPVVNMGFGSRTPSAPLTQ